MADAAGTLERIELTREATWEAGRSVGIPFALDTASEMIELMTEATVGTGTPLPAAWVIWDTIELMSGGSDVTGMSAMIELARDST